MLGFADSLLALGSHTTTTAGENIRKAFVHRKGEYNDAKFRVQRGGSAGQLALMIEEEIDDQEKCEDGVILSYACNDAVDEDTML